MTEKVEQNIPEHTVCSFKPRKSLFSSYDNLSSISHGTDMSDLVIAYSTNINMSDGSVPQIFRQIFQVKQQSIFF